MGRYDRLKFIWERIPQTTSFEFERSLPQGTACMFKMKMLSRAGVMYMDHIILDSIEAGSICVEFVL